MPVDSEVTAILPKTIASKGNAIQYFDSAGRVWLKRKEQDRSGANDVNMQMQNKYKLQLQSYVNTSPHAALLYNKSVETIIEIARSITVVLFWHS